MSGLGETVREHIVPKLRTLSRQIGLCSLVLGAGLLAAQPATAADPAKPVQKNEQAREQDKRSLIELGFMFKWRPVAYNAPFAAAVKDVPEDVRYHPSLDDPYWLCTHDVSPDKCDIPPYIEAMSAKTKSSLSTDFSAGPVLRVGLISVSGGIEFPLRLLTLPVKSFSDGKMYFSEREPGLYYYLTEHEGFRTFGEIGLRISDSFSLSVGYSKSSRKLEAESGLKHTSHDCESTSGYYPGISDHYWCVNPSETTEFDTYRKYGLARSTLNRFYILISGHFPDSNGTANLELSYSRNPFYDKSFSFQGQQLNMQPSGPGRFGMNLSFTFSTIKQ